MRHGRDDAAGDRLPDAERIADREHQIADLGLIGILKLEIRQLFALGFDAQHGKIGMLVGRHHGGVELAAVGQHHADLIGAANDMIAGHDQAIGFHDHARAERFFQPFAAEAGR